MIVAALSDRERYYSTHELFHEAFDYAMANYHLLEEGRHVVVKDKIDLIIANNDLRDRNEAPLEAHREYIDIQIVLSGTESYGVRDRNRCGTSCDGYDSERDIEFFEDKFENLITLHEGDFAVFFPEDAHAPLIGEGKVKKAILKIRK